MNTFDDTVFEWENIFDDHPRLFTLVSLRKIDNTYQKYTYQKLKTCPFLVY